MTQSPPASGVVFAFSGQGSQYPGMTARLYLDHARYRTHLEAAADALRPYTGTSIIDLIVGGDERIHQTGFTQPGVFAVEYALAATLIEHGVRPAAVVGHSIGEFAAAVTAGALSLEDAALLVAVRGAFMQYLPAGGGMMAVRADADDVAELLAAEEAVVVAAYNGPQSITLAGDLLGLDRVQQALAARKVAARRLQVSHAFHSPLMRPMLRRFARVLERVPSAVPRLPYYSTVRGRKLSGEALGAAYWVEQVTAPVRFAPAIDNLLVRQRPEVLLEVGPKQTLTGLLKKIVGPDGPECVAVCRTEDTGDAAFNELVCRLAPERTAEDRITRAVLDAVTEIVDDPSVEAGLDQALHGDLGFDSVMFLRLKFQLEQRLPELGALSMPDMLSSLRTPGTLVDYLRTQVDIMSAV
jgi:[acyl-carrier-protein] S-malonyltransferase